MHLPTRRAPPCGVVEQVDHCALEQSRVAVEVPRAHPDVEADGERPTPDPLDGPVDDCGQLERLRGGGLRVLARELDDIADEGAQLVDLGPYVRQQCGPLDGVQGRATLGGLAVALREEVQVGAQARQRGAQLVPGVGNQPVLPIAGLGQRGEHRVEADRESGDLVIGGAGVDLDGLGPARPGDVLRGGGQPPDRSQPRPGDDEAGEGGESDADEGDEEQHEAEARQRPLGRRRGLREQRSLGRGRR